MRDAGIRKRIRNLAFTLLVAVGSVPTPNLYAADKTLHIGILSSGFYDTRSGLEQELINGLREQGYVEGKNLVIERRYGGANMSHAAESARVLAGLKLDAIVTTCSPSTRAAKEATSSTPIVMAAVSDPVGQKIISSLAKPGQNVTGLSSQAEELLPKRLELMAALIPGTATIAVLANGRNPVHELGWKKLETGAQLLKIKLMKIEVRSRDEIIAGVETAARARAGALFLLPDDPMFYNNRALIVELAAKYRLPDFYWASDYVEAGGLMSYGESLRSSYREVAAYIDKIAKGSSPATLPVTQPTRFELVINQKSAKLLGVTIPGDVLVRANKVIE